MDFSILESFDSPLWVILAGVALLLFGRRLFWVAVGLAGFVLGYVFAVDVVGTDAEWLGLALAVLVGLVGALLAVFFKKLALAVVGLLAGVFFTVWIAADMGWDTGEWIWLAALVAGVIGALLAGKVFDIALVVISSLIGASLLVDVITWPAVDRVWLFLGMAILGVAFQLLVSTRKRRD